MPEIPDIDTPLSDGTVTLRLSAERDIPEILIAYQDDPQLHLSLGEERSPTGAQLGARQERAGSERAQGLAVALTVTEPAADTCIGQVWAGGFVWAHRRAEIGLWLAPAARGRGYGSRALRLMTEWLFSRGGVERVELLIQSGNQAMLRSAQAAGFRSEGMLRGYTLQRGGRVDTAVMARLVGDLES